MVDHDYFHAYMARKAAILQTRKRLKQKHLEQNSQKLQINGVADSEIFVPKDLMNQPGKIWNADRFGMQIRLVLVLEVKWLGLQIKLSLIYQILLKRTVNSTLLPYFVAVQIVQLCFLFTFILSLNHEVMTGAMKGSDIAYTKKERIDNAKFKQFLCHLKNKERQNGEACSFIDRQCQQSCRYRICSRKREQKCVGCFKMLHISCNLLVWEY